MKKKKRVSKKLNTLLLCIVVIGLGIMSYPSISNWWNDRHMTKAIASYVEEVNQISDDHKKEILAQVQAYNASLLPGVDFELTEEEYQEYASLLDISGTGIMGYIQIPEIDVNLPIYHGTDETVLQVATGHIAGSSFPIGGAGTHAVISGHRGLPTAELFSKLDRLNAGDKFTITVLDQVVTYQVDQIRIVLPEDTSDLAIESNKDYVTLVTCTPYGVNSHRMLVRGVRVDNDIIEKMVVVEPDAKRISPKYVIGGIAIPLILFAMVISFVKTGIRKKRTPSSDLLEQLETNMISEDQKGGENHETIENNKEQDDSEME